MAEWTRDRVDPSTINNGNEYDKNSQLSVQSLNSVVNSGLYAQDFVEHMADEPDTSEAGNVGTPQVEIIENEVDGKSYRKFKFSNLKGATGKGLIYMGAWASGSNYNVGDLVKSPLDNDNIYICENDISTSVTDPSKDSEHWSLFVTNGVNGENGKDGSNSTLPIGSIIWGAMPLDTACVHMLDGSTISQTGIYTDFCTYLKSLLTEYPYIECTQSEFDDDVSRTGNCGKFVIDDTNGTVRLPKITKYVEGLSSLLDIGKSLEAGLPNIVGKIIIHGGENASIISGETGVFKGSGGSTTQYRTPYQLSPQSGADSFGEISFDASRSSSLYGSSTTVQTSSTQYPCYIVLANGYKNDTQVNLDNYATELNGKLAKADVKRYVIDAWQSSDGRSWYALYNDGWREYGITNLSGGSWSLKTITFPIAFSNTNYNVNISYRFLNSSSSSVTTQTLSFMNKTSSSIQMYYDDGVIKDVYCCGY